MAVAIVPIRLEAAAGVAAPSMRSAPPALSLMPAARALARVGRMSSAPIICSVPSRPGPPNQPNNFWVPCPTKSPPITARAASLPMSMRPPPRWMVKAYPPGEAGNVADPRLFPGGGKDQPRVQGEIFSSPGLDERGEQGDHGGHGGRAMNVQPNAAIPVAAAIPPLLVEGAVDAHGFDR